MNQDKPNAQLNLAMEHIYEREEFGEPWFTYPNLYSDMINQLPNGSTMVEVGSWKGKSIAYFVVEAINRGKQITSYSVDTWEGSEEHIDNEVIKSKSLYEVFLNNTAPIKEKFFHIRKPSVEAAADFIDDSLDFVFIDAAHDYESVKTDIVAWINKVKSGGVIAGHDYLFPDVKRAVDEYFGDSVLFRDSMENCWIVEIE